MLESLSPAQQVVKVVHEELVTVLGSTQSRLVQAAHPPSIVMLVGLQGSGKTTTAAKLGLHFKRSGQVPLLVAADTRRPAAIDQLFTLAKQLDLHVYSEDQRCQPTICRHSLERARELAAHWVIVDTQGRLHIDEVMMKEVADVERCLSRVRFCWWWMP